MTTTTRPIVRIHDLSTDEVIDREMNDAEFAQYEADQAAQAERIAAEAAKVAEKEALIGVSMTGIASGTVLNLNMKEAANMVKDENARVAEMIGTNKAARSTTVKPEGTSSLVLGTSSGIHAWHNDFYVRRIRVGKNESIYQYYSQNIAQVYCNFVRRM